jgi:hypothetical protein
MRQGQLVRTEHAVSSAVTSAPPERAHATMLLCTIRGHGGIKHRSHDGREVTFDEDRSHLRSAAASLAFSVPSY